jgi:hypothetical protein
VMVVLLKRAENSAAGPRQLEPYAAVAVIVGVLAMAAISGARFALERALGMPPLT